MSAAAIDDVTAWCLLAFVVGVTQSQMAASLYVAAGAVVFVLVMLFLVRPLLARLARAEGEPAQFHVALLFVGLLLSALATDAIGIHAIFGAFLFGAMIPDGSPIARQLGTQLRGVVTVLLLPAFFAFTGMRTRIDLVSGGEAWLLCALILLVAVAGKFVGTVAGSRIAGLPWRDATVLGVLLNTRGLMELIVLNIGLELGVISPPLFAMMVLMALATTMMTGPLLTLTYKP